jgi:LPXTG-motif cell wall-anchored protein
MLLLRTLLITAVAMTGIAIVLWLVSLITGETGSPIGLVVGACSALVAAWAFLALRHAEDGGQEISTQGAASD